VDVSRTPPQDGDPGNALGISQIATKPHTEQLLPSIHIDQKSMICVSQAHPPKENVL